MNEEKLRPDIQAILNQFTALKNGYSISKILCEKQEELIRREHIKTSKLEVALSEIKTEWELLKEQYDTMKVEMMEERQQMNEELEQNRKIYLDRSAEDEQICTLKEHIEMLKSQLAIREDNQKEELATQGSKFAKDLAIQQDKYKKQLAMQQDKYKKELAILEERHKEEVAKYKKTLEAAEQTKVPAKKTVTRKRGGKQNSEHPAIDEQEKENDKTNPCFKWPALGSFSTDDPQMSGNPGFRNMRTRKRKLYEPDTDSLIDV